MKDDHQVQLELVRAVEAHRAGDLKRAERGYRGVLRLRPRQFDALHLLGLIHYAKGRLESALRRIDEALDIAPDAAEAHSNRSIVRLALGDAFGALEDADQALRRSPTYAAAHNNRANALLALEQIVEALAAFDRAIEQDPNLAEAWSGRSVALYRLRQLGEAEASARRAVALSPGLADGWCNLGLARHELGDDDGAFAGYERALALNPQHPDALYNRGIAHHGRGEFEQALRDLEAARLRKRFDGDDGQILHTRMNLCDWRDLARSREGLAAAIRSGALATTPFNTLGVFDDPDLHRLAARTYVSKCFPLKRAPARKMRATRERLRVAYLSADFRGHPTSYLLIETLELHDRARIESIGLSIGPRDDSSFGVRVRNAFERFVDARAFSDDVLIDTIADMEVDILVDLMGHTRLGRPGVLAGRPAPLQVNFLGYPGTMGAPYVDYLIADATVAAHADGFDEALCVLPHAYQPTSALPTLAAPTTRTAHGLPESAFVFCCFCNNWKITPEVFAVWMRLLASTPDSVLWLLANTPGVADNLRQEALTAGVNPQRLIFAPRTDHANHIARHALADLAIDTFPYGAHTTASDALRVGVPLVTRYGRAFQSRVALSVLSAAGLGRFAVNTWEAYEAMALTLASDPKALADARQAVAAAAQSALFDSALFTRNLEAAYTAMSARADAGLSPGRIEIRAD